MTIEYKDFGLDSLIKAIKGVEDAHVKVGILGNEDGRDDSASNATIGFRHEFGVGLPVRSFLRMPLTLRFDKEMQASGAMDESAVQSIMEQGSIIPYLGKVGVLAEGIIQDAFNTRGFGRWKESDYTYKKNNATLVETQQLRNSIVSEVYSD